MLSSLSLKSVAPPESGVLELWDDVSRGLCLRVFPSGRKSWTFRYRPREGGSRRRIGLGGYPDVGLAEARRRADKHRGNVADGADPQGDRQAKRKAPTLGEIADRYLSELVQPKKKARTYELYKYYLDKLVPADFRSRKAYAIKRNDLAELHRTIGAGRPASANRVLDTLSGVYSFAGKHGLIPEGFNPARGIDKFPEQGRERYLSTKELGRLGEVLRQATSDGLPWPEKERAKHARKPENQRSKIDPYVAAAFYLLLFTGCRLREILNLRWSEVDIERGLLLLPDSKTGRKAVIVNAAALEVLTTLPRLGNFVIAGDDPNKPRPDLKKPWDLIRYNAGIEDVRIHDLRHTHASIGAGAGLGLPIIGKLLGHKHAETTQKYAHLDNDPLRRASDKIGAMLAVSLQKPHGDAS